jgi:hypothetical protein
MVNLFRERTMFAPVGLIHGSQERNDKPFFPRTKQDFVGITLDPTMVFAISPGALTIHAPQELPFDTQPFGPIGTQRPNQAFVDSHTTRVANFALQQTIALKTNGNLK